MKLSKKKVFTLALAICMIAILSLGSLAWFTAEDSVTNNFYVGDSTTDPDDVFGVDVWETVNGEEIGKGTGNDEGATYENILPGEILNKAPVLENTGVHPQYVRAIVTVSEGYLLREAMEGAWGDAAKFLAGTPETWVLEDILYTTDDELVYVYYYTPVLEAKAVTDPIFTDVVIPTGLTLEQAIEMDNFQISILGQVIQSEHLADPDVPGGMVVTAQRAFELYWDAEGTIAGYTDEQILANGKQGNEATTDVYYTITEEPSAEVSLTNEVISVSDSVVTIADTVMNATVIIDSCELTVSEGGYVVKAEGNGGLVVYISTDTTLNGTPIFEVENYMEYFQNVLVFPFSN